MLWDMPKLIPGNSWGYPRQIPASSRGYPEAALGISPTSLGDSQGAFWQFTRGSKKPLHNVHDVHQLFAFMGISDERYTLITFITFTTFTASSRQSLVASQKIHHFLGMDIQQRSPCSPRSPESL